MKNRHASIPVFDRVGRYFKRNSGILLGLLFLCLILWVTTSPFGTSENFIQALGSSSFMNIKNLLTVARQICQNALLAFGMTCVLIVGGIDLTVGSVFGASGVAIVMMLNGGVPLFPAFIISLLLGMFIGLINGSIIAFTGMPGLHCHALDAGGHPRHRLYHYQRPRHRQQSLRV